MLTTISYILISLAVIIILVIVVKKFPALAILDAANVPGEKEAQFKERMIRARMERDLSFISGFFGRIWLFLKRRLGGALKARQAQLKKIRINHKANFKIPWLEKQKKIRVLAAAIQEDLKKEDETAAEEKLVEIISLDSKNLEAFFKLGNLYKNQRKWPEAHQTWEYALKLATQQAEDEKNANNITPQEIYFSLANAEKEAGDLDAALENIREALEREANNPRYLDLILDLSIMRKDKNLAMEYWEKLATANPENQKLAEWKEKIDQLPL